jgi:phage head maturation protease
MDFIAEIFAEKILQQPAHGIHVSGLVVPYNVESGYGDVIKPGAFANFIAKHGNERLPMLADHEWPIGFWVRFWDSPEGLMGEGYVTEPKAQEDTRKHGVHTTSIAFRNHAPDGTKTAHVEGEQPGEGIIEPCLRLTLDDRFKGAHAKCGETFTFHGEVYTAKPHPVFDRIDQLEEVSLTAIPAFPGTHLDFLEG